MLRLAAFAVTSALAAAAAGPLPPLPLNLLSAPAAAPDRLTVAVSNTGNPLADGDYSLECDPVGGNHPRAQDACARLDTFAKNGENPFAPVAKRQFCTMVDGGPATARITGTWDGKKVDATFRRTNGCDIARWNNMEPVLPSGRA